MAGFRIKVRHLCPDEDISCESIHRKFHPLFLEYFVAYCHFAEFDERVVVYRRFVNIVQAAVVHLLRIGSGDGDIVFGSVLFVTVKDDRAFPILCSFADAVVVGQTGSSAVHLTTLFPVKYSTDGTFPQTQWRIETHYEIRRNFSDHLCLTGDRQTVFVYQTIAVSVSLVSYAIDYREFFACWCTNLWSDVTTQWNVFHTRSQFVYIVVDFGPVETEVPVDILRADRVESQCDFVRVGMNLTTVCQQFAGTGRRRQRHWKYLVFDVLTRISIIQRNQVVEEVHVGTDFVRTCILRFQIRVEYCVVRGIGSSTFDGVHDGSQRIESSSVRGSRVIILKEITSLSYFRIRNSQFGVVDYIIFQFIKFCQDETCWHRGIEERTVVARHVGHIVLTSGHSQIKHVSVRSRYVAEETDSTVFPSFFFCKLSGCIVDMIPPCEVIVCSVFVVFLSVALDKFVTCYSVQSPVVIDAPVVVDGQQWVVGSVCPTVVFYLAATAAGVTSVSVAVRVVSGISVYT